MKILGNTVFIIGMTGFLLGLSGYDSNPLIASILALVGMLLTYAGYYIREELFDYDDSLDAQSMWDQEKRRMKERRW